MPDRHFFCRALPSSATLQLYAAASQFVGFDRGTAVSLLPLHFFSLGACRVVLFCAFLCFLPKLGCFDGSSRSLVKGSSGDGTVKLTMGEFNDGTAKNPDLS